MSGHGHSCTTCSAGLPLHEVTPTEPTASASASGAVSAFVPISAPLLRSLDPIQVVRFMKERERYELEIAAKQIELPSLNSLQYSDSIYHGMLKSLL